ncbi:DUF4870 domain-containing protein [Candidatus Woesearchaeota archaeon]|nr:DUF4870 domain-containing protein [Candidatus Woesearchaeota archaeon]
MSKKHTNLCAILAYLLVGIIWYFVDDKMKKDKFVKFHVKQAIVLMVAWILWSVAVGILMSITMFLLAPLMNLLMLVPWVFVVLGIVNAINNKQKELPLIGKYAKKLTF